MPSYKGRQLLEENSTPFVQINPLLVFMVRYTFPLSTLCGPF